MSSNTPLLTNKVALVTGSAKRLGAASVKALHAAGANVVVHYDQSHDESQNLIREMNELRAGSAVSVGTELGTRYQAQWLVEQASRYWNRLDILVNNASSFFPTPLGTISDSDVVDLMASNVSAPLFLIQAAQAELTKSEGSILNMVDIHGFKPYKNHVVYCAAKAALVMITLSMASELAPHIRVNGIAPGAILWPEDGSLDAEQQRLKIAEVPLGHQGTPEDIAKLVVYLSSDAAKFITGEIIKVDGGKSI
ncbi:MAG: pteridine reductase [Granulosicoccaceae bacterium]